MSHVLATVASFDLEVEERRAEFASLLTNYAENLESPAKLKVFEIHHGSVLGLGYLIGRLLYRGKQDLIDATLLSQCVCLLASQLDHNNSTLVSAALCSLGEAGRYSLLPMGEGDETWKSVKTILEKIFNIAKNGKENKLQEAAVTALSHIALGSMRFVVVILNPGAVARLAVK
jgi:hypothetical protein